jgi:hypothetical protein
VRQPLIDAIDTLREMNRRGERKISPDPPLAFVPVRCIVS